MMDLSVSGSQGQFPSSTRVLLALLAFMAEICDQNPVVLSWLCFILASTGCTPLSLCCICSSPSCHRSVLVPYGNYGSSRNLNLRFFSLSPSAALSHCVCVPCCGRGHLRVDLVLESQTNIRESRYSAVGFILTYLTH